MVRRMRLDSQAVPERVMAETAVFASDQCVFDRRNLIRVFPMQIKLELRFNLEYELEASL